MEDIFVITKLAWKNFWSRVQKHNGHHRRFFDGHPGALYILSFFLNYGKLNVFVVNIFNKCICPLYLQIFDLEACLIFKNKMAATEVFMISKDLLTFFYPIGKGVIARVLKYVAYVHHFKNLA